jgi:hypothetical protein
MSGTYCYVWERDLLLVLYFNKLNNEISNKFLKNKKDIYIYELDYDALQNTLGASIFGECGIILYKVLCSTHFLEVDDTF